MPRFANDKERADFEEAMRRKTGLSDGEFSTTTIAYRLGISRRTLQNKLYEGDSALGFILQFSTGYVVGSLSRYSLYGVNATCPGSAQACRQQRREADRRHIDHTRWSTTAVSALSPAKKAPISDCQKG
jgi:hypothetical protein